MGNHKHSILLYLGIALSLAVTMLYCLPLPNSVYRQEFSTVLYDKNGELLGARIARDQQWRFPIDSVLPKKYKTAVMSFEDSRFYYHPGIDPLAIGRAVIGNLKNGRVVSGGSTITMQLARLLRGNHPRTLEEKFKEAFLALRLELHFSKEEIFQRYAGYAPFGGNTVGLAAANWRYFGHSANEMTWAEAALFAVLPNKPNDINPGKNRTRLQERRDNLLRRLHTQGHLNQLELQLALLESLPQEPMPLPDIAPHLLATLQKIHPRQRDFSSTLDKYLQVRIDQIVRAHSRRLGADNINNLAVLVLDNRSQNVVAYIGNRAYADDPLYSPAVDIIQRPRSSGSLFKPFLFAAMLQEGLLLPDSLVLDVPSFYGDYSPENYDRHYRGVVPAKMALTQSLNVPAVRLLQQYGVTLFKQDLQQAGLTTLFRPAEAYGLSLILGGAETTLWDITNAFAGLSLSAQGEADRLQHITALQSKGSSDRKLKQIFPIKQGAAWLTLQALVDVNRPGEAAAWREFSSSQKIAWKTGTSYGWHDAWAVGTNGSFTVGVWAGNANGEEGRELTGTKAAAPVMLDVFSLLPIGEWPQKPYHALKTYEVCADGYLSVQGCVTQTVDAPAEAQFTTTSPYFRQVHLDGESGYQVHGLCESVSAMLHQTQFQLPPVAAFYYQQQHPNYRPLPAWRSDCLSNIAQVENTSPMQVEYPIDGAVIRIPVQLNGELGRTIFKARHQRDRSTLYWHIDEEYIGDTKTIHERAVVVNAGWHKLTLVDELGFRLERWFKVI
jgi:penicillin-binding protein 1C